MTAKLGAGDSVSQLLLCSLRARSQISEAIQESEHHREPFSCSSATLFSPPLRRSLPLLILPLRRPPLLQKGNHTASGRPVIGSHRSVLVYQPIAWPLYSALVDFLPLGPAPSPKAEVSLGGLTLSSQRYDGPRVDPTALGAMHGKGCEALTGTERSRRQMLRAE